MDNKPDWQRRVEGVLQKDMRQTEQDIQHWLPDTSYRQLAIEHLRHAFTYAMLSADARQRELEAEVAENGRK